MDIFNKLNILITHPYGQWKDTGIRLEGDAVQSLTVTFWKIGMNKCKDANSLILVNILQFMLLKLG